MQNKKYEEFKRNFEMISENFFKENFSAKANINEVMIKTLQESFPYIAKFCTKFQSLIYCLEKIKDNSEYSIEEKNKINLYYDKISKICIYTDEIMYLLEEIATNSES